MTSTEDMTVVDEVIDELEQLLEKLKQRKQDQEANRGD